MPSASDWLASASPTSYGGGGCASSDMPLLTPRTAPSPSHVLELPVQLRDRASRTKVASPRAETLRRLHSLESGGKEPNRRVLGVLSVVGLCYFSVSGGPIGSEYVMSSGGPLVGLVFLLLFPLIWGIPIAFITAELSTAYPQDGGYSVWVSEAFSPFWGFQAGYWSWASGVIDNAIYPALAVSTFTDAYGSFGTPVSQYLVKAIIAIALAVPNLLGVHIVGRGMAAMSIFVMVPFLALSVWGMARGGSWSSLGEVRRADIEYSADGSVVSMTGAIDIDWSTLINTIFWNFSGAVDMSVFGGEVHDPARTYPRALLISVLLITLTYLFPLLGAAAFNSPHWTTWEDGTFSSIAKDIGGEVLLTCVVIATFVSNAGMYMAELFCDSFQILGMAECGLAPAFLKSRNKQFNTPHNAIYASLVIIFVLIKFEFDEILGMTNALSAFYQLLVLFAFIKMRYSHKEVNRPFKVPGSLPMLWLLIVIPTAMLVYIAVDVFFTLVPAILVAVFVVAGFAYAHWRKFTVSQFRDLHIES